MKEIDALKEVFLSDEIDEDTRADNEQRIAEWERGLLTHKAFASWQQHDISQQIAAQAREAYKDFGLQLANNRELSDRQRMALWAKQDAALFLLSLIATDASGIVESIEKDIRTALTGATNP